MLNSCCFQVESGLQVDSLTGLVEGEELQLDAVRGQDYTQVQFFFFLIEAMGINGQLANQVVDAYLLLLSGERVGNMELGQTGGQAGGL